HDSIAPQVSAAVHRAVAEHIPVRTEPLRLRDGEHESRITVDVLPIHTTARKPKCFLVFVVPVAATEPAPPVSKDAAETPAPSTLERDQLVQRLRQDVSVTKLYLETLLEER